MIKELLSVESFECNIDRLEAIKPGMAFYEVKIPHNYIEFDRFYIFSHLKPNTKSAKVFFQNAAPQITDACVDDFYKATARNVPYDGIRQAVTNHNQSTLCISDPGIYVEGKDTSWYSVVNNVDICFYIAKFISHWLECASLRPGNVLMFGSSAGSFGALRSATFLKSKTNVISINGQISRSFKYQGKNYSHNLIKYYRKCLQDKINIPNIYLLCNYRDYNTFLNRKFFSLITSYSHKKFIYQRYLDGEYNTYQANIIFDLYDGLNGHSRPRKDNLLQKIDIAEAVLKSSQEEQDFQRNQDKISLRSEIVPSQNKYKTKLKKLIKSIKLLSLEYKEES